MFDGVNSIYMYIFAYPAHYDKPEHNMNYLVIAQSLKNIKDLLLEIVMYQ